MWLNHADTWYSHACMIMWLNHADTWYSHASQNNIPASVFLMKIIIRKNVRNNESN